MSDSSENKKNSGSEEAESCKDFTRDKIWKRIKEDYQNEELHAHYIDLCWKSGHYLDATKNYQERLNKYPDEVIAKKYLKQITLISQMSFLKKQKEKDEEEKREFPKEISIILFITGFLLLIWVLYTTGLFY